MTVLQENMETLMILFGAWAFFLAVVLVWDLMGGFDD